jgi:hypothetical protein
MVGAVGVTKMSGHDSFIISNNNPTLDHSMYTFVINSMKYRPLVAKPLKNLSSFFSCGH